MTTTWSRGLTGTGHTGLCDGKTRDPTLLATTGQQGRVCGWPTEQVVGDWYLLAHNSISQSYNNIDAGFHAADHLLSRGCRSLLFYSPCEAEWVTKRTAGAAERFSLSRSTNCDFEQIVDPLRRQCVEDLLVGQVAHP